MNRNSVVHQNIQILKSKLTQFCACMQVLNQYEGPVSTVPNGEVTQQIKELP
jgi:hypothetical protein